jgi:hypothetical protein
VSVRAHTLWTLTKKDRRIMKYNNEDIFKIISTNYYKTAFGLVLSALLNAKPKEIAY